VLCIWLVLLGGVLSAAHTHAQGDVSHADCGLCVAAHMAVQVAAPPPQIVVVQVFTEVEAFRPVARLQFIPQFDLYSRPPPANLDRS
jgi:hypothetical protein